MILSRLPSRLPLLHLWKEEQTLFHAFPQRYGNVELLPERSPQTQNPGLEMHWAEKFRHARTLRVKREAGKQKQQCGALSTRNVKWAPPKASPCIWWRPEKPRFPRHGRALRTVPQVSETGKQETNGGKRGGGGREEGRDRGKKEDWSHHEHVTSCRRRGGVARASTAPAPLQARRRRHMGACARFSPSANTIWL